MGKIVHIGAEKRPVEVEPGNYVLLCKPNLNWNIHRVHRVVHSGLIADTTWECPHRPYDPSFLSAVGESAVTRNSEVVYRIHEEHLQGVYLTEDRADGVAFAMANAKESFDDAMRRAHSIFMMQMNLVRHG